MTAKCPLPTSLCRMFFFEYTISHTGHAYSIVQYVRQKATAEGKVEKSRSPEIGAQRRRKKFSAFPFPSSFPPYPLYCRLVFKQGGRGKVFLFLLFGNSEGRENSSRKFVSSLLPLFSSRAQRYLRRNNPPFNSASKERNNSPPFYPENFFDFFHAGRDSPIFQSQISFPHADS